jgi:hypothetical protein
MFGSVPKDKSDTRIVVKGPGDGKPPEGLRITKTVRGKDASLYTFLLPGVDRDPLKVSIHPLGKIQLKLRGTGMITRLYKGALIEGLESGALDSTSEKFLRPRLGSPSDRRFRISADRDIRRSNFVESNPDKGVSLRRSERRSLERAFRLEYRAFEESRGESHSEFGSIVDCLSARGRPQ